MLLMFWVAVVQMDDTGPTYKYLSDHLRISVQRALILQRRYDFLEQFYTRMGEND